MQTLLGIVTGTKPDKRGEPVAWVRPLFDVTASWREADPEEFPTRGFLFWPQAKDAVRDGLVFFKPRENAVHVPGVKDDFMVAEPHPALEVLDLRRIGDEEKVRTALAVGIRLPGVLPARTLVWFGDHTVLGPVGLVASPGGITIEKSNRARIARFNLGSGEIRAVTYDGLTRYVVTTPNLGQPDGFVDWDDDKQVVRRAVEFAVDLAKRAGAVGLTKLMVEDAAEQLAGRNSPPEMSLELYRLQRTRHLMNGLERANGIAAEIAGALQSHPTILKELNALKAEECQAARAQAEASLKNEREELSRLSKERESAETALRELERITKEREAEALARTSEIEAQVNARITEAIRSAPALLSEVAVLKPFLGEGFSSIQPRRVAQKYPAWTLGQIQLSSIKDVRSRVLPSFKAAGVPPQTWQRIHSAIAAKLLPVLAGARAIDALAAYARVVTGGRMMVVQVTTALTEAGDIFGRVDTTRRSFVPHPAGLIDVVASARSSDGLMLVVLQGANRGATESYLLPLLRAAFRGSPPIAVFHPTALEASDPYFAHARVEWPKNLLVAATLVEGPTSLPVSPDIWADSVFIQTDGDEAQLDPVEAQEVPEASEINPESDLFTLGKAQEGGGIEPFEDLIRSIHLRDVASRFERAFRMVQNDPTALQREVIRAVIVPFLASIAGDEQRVSGVAEVKKILGAKSVVGFAEAVEAARRSIG